MAVSVSDTVLDTALNYIKNNVTKQTICDTEPTNYTEANSTYALADVVMASGDFTVGDGDTNGRKVAVTAKSGVTVDTTGSANWVCLLDVSGTELLVKTSGDGQTITASNTVDIPTWDYEIRDPT